MLDNKVSNGVDQRSSGSLPKASVASENLVAI